MKESKTALGVVKVGSRLEIFEEKTRLIEAAAQGPEAVSVAFTGGSTPKAYYQWAVEENKLDVSNLSNVYWTTSDERCVPLSSDDSNFGHAQKLLDGLSVAEEKYFPWPVSLAPEEAAAAYQSVFAERFEPGKAYDLCILGMGDDCHTASIFPGSPLIDGNETAFFVAIDVPGKGWRLTITPAGLAACGQVVVIVTGAGKADALHTVFEGERNRGQYPSQIHADYADKVTWLIDDEAAARLSL